MLTRYVLPGDKAEMKILEQSVLADEAEVKEYITKVYDVLSDERFELIMPMEGTKLILLPIGAEYNVCFYTGSGLYQCDIRIADRYKDGNSFLLLCEPISNLRKYQRREYYRFSCLINMRSRELTEDEVTHLGRVRQDFEMGLPMLDSVIVDISGGGIRFVTRGKYEKGALLYVVYSLKINGKEKVYDIAGKILSVKPVANRPGEFEHRLQYLNMDYTEREEIIRYIFEEERKNRQKSNGL